jgi:hypothetical protein
MKVMLIKTRAGMAKRMQRLEGRTAFWAILVILVFFVILWIVVLREKLSPQPRATPRIDMSQPDVPKAPSVLP